MNKKCLNHLPALSSTLNSAIINIKDGNILPLLSYE